MMLICHTCKCFVRVTMNPDDYWSGTAFGSFPAYHRFDEGHDRVWLNDDDEESVHSYREIIPQEEFASIKI